MHSFNQLYFLKALKTPGS